MKLRGRLFLCFLLLGSLPSLAYAQTFEDFGLQVTKSIFTSTSVLQLGTLEHIDEDEIDPLLSLTPPQSIASYFERPQLGTFGAKQFGSALADSVGVHEVGISGSRGAYEARSIAQWWFTNLNDFPVHWGLAFHVPEGRVTVQDGQGLGPTDPQAPRAQAFVNIEYSLSGGPVTSIYDWGVVINGGRVGLDVNTQGNIDLTDISDPDMGTYGFRISEHDGRVQFPEIPPGETLYFQYLMAATGVGVSRSETVTNAFLGDPLNLIGEGGATPFLVPEASSLGLLSAVWSLFILCRCKLARRWTATR